LPLGQRGILTADVPGAVPTPYLRGGWIFGLAAVALALLLVLGSSATAVRSWRREPAFTRLLAALILPGVFVVIGPLLPSSVRGAAAWVIPALTLMTAGLTAGEWRGLAFRPKRAVLSLTLGLVIVAALGYVMVTTYARYGFFARIAPPPAGWFVGGAALLLEALAWEGWLRGAVFTSAAAWRGPGVALLLSTLVPWAVRPGGPPEVLIWSLFVGGIFGLIRWRTGDALGLAVPRAAGLYLLTTLTVLH